MQSKNLDDFMNPFQKSRQIFNCQFTSMDNTDPQTNFSYYHEYCRLYLANVVLLSQMRELSNERNQLSSRFIKLQKKGEQIQFGQANDEDRKKRFRRTANQIQRHYRCPVQTCQRSYGSEGSLNQHLKIKHVQLYEKLNLGRSEDLNEESYISDSLLSCNRISPLK